MTTAIGSPFFLGEVEIVNLRGEVAVADFFGVLFLTLVGELLAGESVFLLEGDFEAEPLFNGVTGFEALTGVFFGERDFFALASEAAALVARGFLPGDLDGDFTGDLDFNNDLAGELTLFAFLGDAFGEALVFLESKVELFLGVVEPFLGVAGSPFFDCF